MKVLVTAIFSLCCILTLTHLGCKSPEEQERERVQEKEAEQDERATHARQLVEKAIFVRHPTADDLCFASYWKEWDRYREGFAAASLAVVSCEKVRHLLVNPAPKEVME